MRVIPSILPLCAMLAACGMDPTGGAQRKDDGTKPAASPTPVVAADPLAAHDPSQGVPLDPSLADDQPRPLMQLQVVLDRLGFTPGVVDGKEGLSTRNAIAGFQEAR